MRIDGDISPKLLYSLYIMLKKINRLVSDQDFTLVYKKGEKYRGNYGMLSVLRVTNLEDKPRFGFVVGKKVGNAVIRHRHTRRLREITREYITENPDAFKGTKISYIAHKYSNDYSLLREELMGQLEKAHKVD